MNVSNTSNAELRMRLSENGPLTHQKASFYLIKRMKFNKQKLLDLNLQPNNATSVHVCQDGSPPDQTFKSEENSWFFPILIQAKDT